MKYTNIIAILFHLILSVLAYFIWLFPRNQIPLHMLGHAVIDRPNFFTNETIKSLIQYTRDLKIIRANTRDAEITKPLMEDIGEAVPIIKEGSIYKCNDPYLVPNINKTHCIFPGRIDIGRHYILSGGSQGRKDSYETAISRLQSFIHYGFKNTNYGIPSLLLKSPEFLNLAKSVCPRSSDVLDPFQFNIIAQLPGQTVATHIDGVYFWGANRFIFPQWLLAAMIFSGLFQDKFINQVQVVGYFHEWKDPNNTRYGNFMYWNEKDGPNPAGPKLAYPHSGSANAMDGSITIHTAEIFMPEHIPPFLPTTADNEIRYEGEDKWGLYSNNERLALYSENEMRFSVVYRARCFKDENEMETYRKTDIEKNMMTLEEIMNVFRDDIVNTKKIISGFKAFDDLSTYKKAILIMDTYIKYPYSETSIFPFNYCSINKLFPWTNYILKYFCS